MIHSIKIEEEEARTREALKKNNEELDKLCKTICLFVGWLCVFCIIIYTIIIIIDNL